MYIPEHAPPPPSFRSMVTPLIRGDCATPLIDTAHCTTLHFPTRKYHTLHYTLRWTTLRCAILRFTTACCVREDSDNDDEEDDEGRDVSPTKRSREGSGASAGSKVPCISVFGKLCSPLVCAKISRWYVLLLEGFLFLAFFVRPSLWYRNRNKSTSSPFYFC